MRLRPLQECEWETIRREWVKAIKCCDMHALVFGGYTMYGGYIHREDSKEPIVPCENGLHFFQCMDQATLMNPYYNDYPFWTEVYYNPNEVVHEAGKSVCRELYLPTPEQSSLKTSRRRVPIVMHDALFHNMTYRKRVDILLYQIMRHAIALADSSNEKSIWHYLDVVQDAVETLAGDVRELWRGDVPYITAVGVVDLRHPCWYFPTRDRNREARIRRVQSLARTEFRDIGIRELFREFYCAYHDLPSEDRTIMPVHK